MIARFAAVASLLAVLAAAHDNGLGHTPAMGYNTWNDFRCDNITAANIMAVADKMAALGLHKVGYEYINIDDCWAVGRDTNGALIADPVAFPDGMAAVASYVHNKGFKFGIYTDRGNFTCAGRPGSWGFETIDAQTFANWGVDYLKEDSCFAPTDHNVAFAQYADMRDALNQTGRPIYFSLCGWYSWYAPVGWDLGNSWRISGDVNYWQSLYNSVAVNLQLASYARPGGWNDPDMLVGSSPYAAVHLTEAQSRTQFSLWAVMASPLLIGSNILNMTEFDLETYSNAEVISVDQDSLGLQGSIVSQNCGVRSFEDLHAEADVHIFSAVPPCQQTWAKRLHDGSFALLLVNYASNDTVVSCDWYCLASLGFSTDVHVRDLWAHSDLGSMNPIAFIVPGGGASRLLRISSSSLTARSSFDPSYQTTMMVVLIVGVALAVGVAVAFVVTMQRRQALQQKKQSQRQGHLSDPLLTSLSKK